MNFKTIKSLDEESFNGIYEMSEDGKAVRLIKDQTSAKLFKKGEKDMVEMLDATNLLKKAFGVKTLYWSSWGKPLPGAPVAAKAKPAEEVKTPRKKAFKGETSLTTRDNQLLSKFILGKVDTICENRIKMGYDADMCEINDTKEQLGRIILHNVKKGLVFVNLFNANWREGYWFLNPKTGAYLKFDEAKHKPGYGTEAIIWPNI